MLPTNTVRMILLHHVSVTTHTHNILSGYEEVENRTSQLAEPCNFPQHHNTTLLHEFYLAITQILELRPHNA